MCFSKGLVGILGISKELSTPWDAGLMPFPLGRLAPAIASISALQGPSRPFSRCPQNLSQRGFRALHCDRLGVLMFL